MNRIRAFIVFSSLALAAWLAASYNVQLELRAFQSVEKEVEKNSIDKKTSELEESEEKVIAHIQE